MEEVVTMWCEWDIGCNEDVFDNIGTAHAIAEQALLDCGIDESLDQLLEEGLIGFEHKEVRTSD